MEVRHSDTHRKSSFYFSSNSIGPFLQDESNDDLQELSWRVVELTSPCWR